MSKRASGRPARRTVKRKAKRTAPRGGPTIEEALEWLARHYPEEWSRAAVCHWLATHPVVQSLLMERLKTFAAGLLAGAAPLSNR